MLKPDLVDKALEQIQKRPATYEYFFNKLKSPEWIIPLFNKGMFRYPPKAEREGNNIGFPIWPESRYLARMASIAPEDVLNVALAIPETDNVRVHEDLAEAACGMPPKLAAKWANKEAQWISTQEYLYFLLPAKLADLVSHLVSGNQIGVALRLGRELFGLLPDPSTFEKASARLTPEPRARFDAWDYGEIIKSHLPGLISAGEVAFFSLFCDLLETALRYSIKDSAETNAEDFSFIFRPAIEDHDQNHDSGVRDFLITAVRDAGDLLIKSKGRDVLQSLESRPFKVFHRIALYLRQQFPDVDPAGTASLLAKHNVLDDPSLHHELFHLLQEEFGNMSGDVQDYYLAFIHTNFDIENWIEFREREQGVRPTIEEAEQAHRYRQYQGLYPVQVYLTGKWRELFEQLKAEFGDLAHPEFLYYSGATWVGPTSPKGKDEMSSMAVDDLIDFLKSWEPAQGWDKPSPEGLGRELTALVASTPQLYAPALEKFQSLDPPYLRGMIEGFREAVKNEIIFSWEPVLALCSTIVNQPREIQGWKGEYADLDPGWVWTRKRIASLLSAGLEKGKAKIPIGLRKEVWEVLRPLTDDPEPTEEQELRQISTMDPATLSINTIRGEAMHTVIRYALWVRRHIEMEKLVNCSFDEMPEVLEVLNYHLDPLNDPTLSIHSVYGQWFPQLVYLDRNWSADNVLRIFPKGDGLEDLRLASWETYIVFCSPYDSTLELLIEEYEAAIDRLNDPCGQRRLLADPHQRLAEHLVSFYWRGKLDLHHQLITKFYSNANEVLRGHVIGFVGRLLDSAKDDPPLQVIERLKALWEWRFAKSKKISPVPTPDLVHFGWWFASGKFDPSWSITQLRNTLNLTCQIEPAHKVVEKLSAIASNKPVEAVECLRLMIEGDRKGWYTSRWKDNVRSTLTAALRAADDDVRQRATDLIHELGARGYLEFRDLLTQSAGPH